MRVVPLFSSVAAVLAARCSFAQAVTSAATPQFETLFLGTFELGNIQSLKGPFGTRLHAPINGGNMTDPSGKLVATILPAADTGVLSDSGIFFPDAVLSIIWEVDGKLATLHTTGVGLVFQTNLTYTHLETDSETYSSLNSRFLVTNTTFSADAQSQPTFTVFGAL